MLSAVPELSRSAQLVAHGPFSGRRLSVSADLESTTPTSWAETQRRRSIVSKYLIVANQTLGGDHLMDEVRRRAATGPSSFYVIVPNTRSVDAARASGAPLAPATASASSEEDHRATLISQSRLQQALARLRAEG